MADWPIVMVDWTQMFGPRTVQEQAAMNPGLSSAVPHASVALVAPAVAVVNGGRWIAHCPWCAGAEYVNFAHLVFFCCNCRNQQAGNSMIPLTAPDAATKAAIEAALAVRPDVSTRNWTTETVQQLLDENTAMGL